MFERFTEAARASVVPAQVHAHDLRQSHIGSPHLLLGVLDTPSAGRRVLADAGADVGSVLQAVRSTEGSGADAASLRTLGIDVDEVRRRAEASFGAGALDRVAPRRGLFARAGHLPLDWSGRTALQDALEEALTLRHHHIGTEHLLLAFLRRPEGPAARTLLTAGVRLDRAAALPRILAELRRSA